MLGKIGPACLPKTPHEVKDQNGLLVVTLVFQPIDHFLKVRVGLLQELFSLSQTELPESLASRFHFLEFVEGLTDPFLGGNCLLTCLKLALVKAQVDSSNDPVEGVMILDLA